MHLTNPSCLLSFLSPQPPCRQWISGSTHPSQYIYTHNNCIIFIQRRPDVSDVGPTLYKFYTNVFVVIQYNYFYHPRSPEHCEDRFVSAADTRTEQSADSTGGSFWYSGIVCSRRASFAVCHRAGGILLSWMAKGGGGGYSTRMARGGGDTASTAAPTDPCARSYKAVSHILDRGQKEITVIHRSWLLHHACGIKCLLKYVKQNQSLSFGVK